MTKTTDTLPGSDTLIVMLGRGDDPVLTTGYSDDPQRIIRTPDGKRPLGLRTRRQAF